MTAPAPSRPARRRSATLNRPLALLVAGTFFMENLDGTIIATAAPAIACDFGVAPSTSTLAMTGYLSRRGRHADQRLADRPVRRAGASC